MELTTKTPNWNSNFSPKFVDNIDFRLNQPRPYAVSDIPGPRLTYQGPWPLEGPWSGYKR